MKLLEPHNLDVHMNLAQLFFDMKKYKEAITIFQDALKIESSPREKISHSLGLLYHMIGNDLQAEYWYRNGNTQTPQYHYDFAVTLQRNGKVLILINENVE
jgi:tetratricopeptide (TPR) repeat protein